jgi:MFS family permease
MSRRMLVSLLGALFVCGLYGNGVLPLLPVYALEVSASPTFAGWFTAFAFLSLAAGSLSAGRPGGFLQRRSFLLLLTLAAIPLIAATGRVTRAWQLMVLTGVSWLGGGILLTGLTIIASRHAAESERGRVFGLIGVTMNVSAFVGSMAIGALVDRFGYATMFAVVAASYLLVLAALALLPRVPVEPFAAPAGPAGSPAARSRIGAAAFLLLVAQFVVCIANGVGHLGRSLLMNERLFSASAITSTMAIGALVVLPVPFVLGWLSDRVGRRAILAGCFASGATSLAMLVVSRTLWQFWIVGVLLGVLGVSLSIGPAFVADLVAPAHVGVVVSRFNAAYYLGTVIGMAALVPVSGALGMPLTLLSAAAAAAIGIFLLLAVRRPGATAKPAGAVTPP